MNAKVAETLNQVSLPVVPFNTCKKMDYWWFQVKTSMICMGYTLPDELKSVCQVLKWDIYPHSIILYNAKNYPLTYAVIT